MSGDEFPSTRLGEVLRPARRPITPEADKTYDLIGVRWYAAGTHLHDTIEGAALQAPTLWRVREGDIVYNKMWTSKGAFAVASKTDAKLFGTSEYPTFEPLDRLSTDFLVHVFRQRRFWRLAEAWTNGTTERARLSPKDFLRLPVKLPPLPYQLAIAEVLGALQDAIEAQKIAIDAVRDAKRPVMRELLTRGVRRAGAPLKPLPGRWILGRIAEGITHVPRDWNLVTLASVAKLESGHTPSREKPEYWGGDVPWLSLADTDALEALTVDQTSECVTPQGIANSSARVLPKDTVALSRTATVGKATRLNRPMATSQDFANWICGASLHPQYLVQVFRHMQREWQRLQEGSTHQTIYMPVFKKLQILLPPLAEQKAISEIGEAFDLRLSTEQRALDTLTQILPALSQELLSGRLRLPESMIARHRDKAGQAA